MQFIQGLGLDDVLAELKRLRRPREAVPGRADGACSGGTVDVSAAIEGLLTGQFPPARSGRPAHTVAEGEGVPADLPPAPASESSFHLPGQAGSSTLSDSGRQYWQSVARIGAQVAEALAYASSQGVLHRDIKPSNLLLDEQGTVWVTDFGLAKAESDPENLTESGDLVGTLGYMAPERFRGQGDVRADIYSLGLTLYELLTLRPAFEETDRNRLLRTVMHDEPPRPRKANPAVPRDLETIVLKATARDSAHRYRTPNDLADDLRRFVDDRTHPRPASQRGGKTLALVPAQPRAGRPHCLGAGPAGPPGGRLLAQLLVAAARAQRDARSQPPRRGGRKPAPRGPGPLAVRRLAR
jgi:hypothetical protein